MIYIVPQTDTQSVTTTVGTDFLWTGFTVAGVVTYPGIVVTLRDPDTLTFPFHVHDMILFPCHETDVLDHPIHDTDTVAP